MTKNTLLKDNVTVASKIVTNCMMVCAGFLFIAWFLNYIGVFIIDRTVMTAAAVLGAVFFCTALVSIYFHKKRQQVACLRLIVLLYTSRRCYVFFAYISRYNPSSFSLSIIFAVF